MAEQETTGIGWFIAGLGLGALLGVLFAPKAGRELREGLITSAKDSKDYVTARSREARDQINSVVDRGREQIERVCRARQGSCREGPRALERNRRPRSAAIRTMRSAASTTTRKHFTAVQPRIAFSASQRQARHAIACRFWLGCSLQFYTCAYATEPALPAGFSLAGRRRVNARFCNCKFCN